MWTPGSSRADPLWTSTLLVCIPLASFPGSAQTVEAQAQSHLSAMQAPSYGIGAPHQWMQSWPG